MSNIKQNFQDYGLPYSGNTPEAISQNLEFLYNKIEQCTRKNSYFDLYKITTIVNNSADLDAAITALPPCSSLVVNTPIVTSTGKSYNIGDVVLKLNDGSIESIYAQRGGIFYPSKITKTADATSTYQIEFSYNSSTPADGTTQTNQNTGWNITTPTKTIIFDGITDHVSGSPYNKITQSNTITFNAAKDGSNNNIPPIAHINWNNEEVYADISIKYNQDSTYTIQATNMTLSNYTLVVK